MDNDLEGLYKDCLSLIHSIESLEDSRKNSTQSFLDVQATVSTAIKVADGLDCDESHLERFRDILLSIAKHTHDALLNDHNYFEELIQVLRVASRNPIWRKYFGWHIYDLENEMIRGRHAQPPGPDCVLEVARSVCTREHAVSNSAIEHALAIIANCCADDDINRKLIIHRDGINLVMTLMQHGIDIGTVISVLYNICVDYDEPATYAGVLYEPEYMRLTGLDEESLAKIRPSLAAEKLASSCSAYSYVMTFELFLALQYKIDESLMDYLAELIEIATKPAVCGWRYVRASHELPLHQWPWSVDLDLDLDCKSFDTVTMFVELGLKSFECLCLVTKAVLNILGQRDVLVTLLRRDDDSIWKLLTLACMKPSIDADDSDEISSEELVHLRKLQLKTLYLITSNPSFSSKEKRAQQLMQTSLDQLEKHVVKDQTGRKVWSRKQDVSFQEDQASSQTFLLASACVVISQLAASEKLRQEMFLNDQLMHTMELLLRDETSLDVLYPAITIIGRIALSTETNFDAVNLSLMVQMKRLLIQGGLGLTIPLEAVVAFKNMVRGRPEMLNVLFLSQHDSWSIANDIFKLWKLTSDASIKLEIGKFFHEALRMANKPTSTSQDTSIAQLNESLKMWMDIHSPDAASVFAWVCTKAEPLAERAHGWFGLAVLSTLLHSQTGVFKVLESQPELRDAMLVLSNSKQDDTSCRNLKLTVHELMKASKYRGIPLSVQETLQQAAENLGLVTKGSST